MGRSKHAQIPKRILNRLQFQYSFAHQASTGGTGKFNRRQSSPARLLKSTMGANRKYIGNGVRSSMLYKPMKPQEKKHLRRKLGNYGRPMPLDLNPLAGKRGSGRMTMSASPSFG